MMGDSPGKKKSCIITKEKRRVFVTQLRARATLKEFKKKKSHRRS